MESTTFTALSSFGDISLNATLQTIAEKQWHIPPDQVWMVVVGFVISLVLAFGIGANDVANSFGTSVGSRVLTLRQACILAAIFETLGAVLIGYKVSDTIRKGIADVEPFVNNTELLMLGNVATLSGSCIWMVAATILRMPVSATHSIVGATVGFALVVNGTSGINWPGMIKIIASWFISPVLAGVVSTLVFYFCKFFILSKKDPLEPGLKFLPLFYAVTISINLFSVFYEGPHMLHFDRIPSWGAVIISVAAALLVYLIVRVFIVPWQRERIKKDCANTDRLENDTPLNKSDSSIEDGTNTPGSCKSTAQIMMKSDMALKRTEHEKSEKEKSANLLHPNAANNIILMKNEANKLDKSPNKSEGASLMDNEYKFGQVTPNKGDEKNTIENLKAANEKLEHLHDEPNGEQKKSSTDVSVDLEIETGGRDSIKDRPETLRLFSFLQVLTATFGAFAHGGNDVSNAIGPLVGLWLVGTTQLVRQETPTPLWILFVGGVGISLGLWFWGFRVIKTLGEDLTKITPSSGFCIEIGSAVTVLVASNAGIPISTTHCKVGSVVFVGRFRSKDNVDWSVFRNIVLAWLVTLPITGGLSAATMAILRAACTGGSEI